MKIKLDDYDVRVRVNGLFRQHTDYDEDINAAIDEFILRLADVSNTMKANRKKEIPFEPVEARIVRLCLLNWRNDEIRNDRNDAAEAISELLIRFTG